MNTASRRESPHRPRFEGVRRLLLAALMLSPGALLGQAGERLDISQVRQLASGETEVRVYADLEGTVGEAAEPTLGVEDVAATLGQEVALVRGVRPFTDSQEGVGYVFLVDVSASLNDELFAQIRSALDDWVSRLRPQDRAAIVAFGSQSRVVVDWTDDLALLREALDRLEPTDRDTLLYQAIFDALDLGERRDEGLPGRRVVVVLSDGRDEGSGQALDDVLDELRRRPLPIYAIGFSQLQGAQRVTYLDVLRRLATNSGGAFFEADRTQLAEAYERIAEAVNRVWVIDLECPQCIPDGRALRLQLSIRSGNRVLSKGTDVRLLPLAALSGRRTAPSAESGTVVAESDLADVDAPSAQPEEAAGPGAGGDPVAGTSDPGASADSEAEPAAEGVGGAGADGGRERRFEGQPLLLMGIAVVMVALIVIGLLARRAASSSEITAEMVRTELNKALGRKPAEESVDEETGGVSSADTSSSGRSGSAMSGAAAAAAAAREAVRAEEEAERVRQREQLVERALREGGASPQRKQGAGQALFVPRTVRLVTVRGIQKGKQYRAIVRESLSVGARSSNDVVLVDEPGAPPELLRIVQDEYRLQLQAGDKQTVLCNGLPPEAGDELRSGDLIGTRDLIFRIVLDD